jgi:hypothetical protein
MLLDHLVIIAPDLEQGAQFVRQQLGVDMMPGGQHVQMGTHNLLLRVGEQHFLEVIARDPDALPPAHPRWFGLDDEQQNLKRWVEGQHLNAWVVQTDNIDEILKTQHHRFGRKRMVSRGMRSWHFAVPEDGSLPCGGILPSLISWGEQGSAVGSMPESTVRLKQFCIEHPEAEQIRALYRELGLDTQIDVIDAPELRYRAVFDTPLGLVELS